MAAYSVVWSDQAHVSLLQACTFIADDSLEGAKTVVRELVKHAQTLENLPRRNPIEPTLTSASVEYRFLVKWNF